MDNLKHKLKLLITDKKLRKRILFVFGMLIVFRLLAAIPIPGVDQAALNQFLSSSQLFGILNVFSGGGLSNLSIIMLGVGPYITASIIMQLLAMMIPKLKEMNQEEGESGRKRFAQYTRILSVPLSIIQGFALLSILTQQGVIVDLTVFERVINLIMIVAGGLLTVWIGELMTEFGIGNGISLLIFAGIVAQLPQEVSQFAFTFDPTSLPLYILFLAIGLVVIAGVVLISEAERPIEVTYARQVRGTTQGGGVTSYIPLRINMAGVIPIIFALSLLLIPQIVGNLLATSTQAWVLSVSQALTAFGQTTWLYAIVYFVLVFAFTYFYTAVTFDPVQMANNLQKGGAFISGIRPGESTVNYISSIVTRITLVGGLFLGIIAVLPLIIQAVSGITALAIGGTALLIVVSVVLDLLKKLDAQAAMREY